MGEVYRILLVEDEEHLRDTIKLNLDLEGYKVVAVDNGSEALERARNERYDLIILDVMLPKLDGFTICKTIRLEGIQVPVMFLTAKQSGKDRVEGLKIGGDDYLTKPFNLEELLLRVQKLIARRTIPSISELDTFDFGKNHINFKSFQIRDKNGKAKILGKKEMMLLKLLVNREGEVVRREEILETVWGYDVFPSTRTVDNYIMALRKHFEANPRKPNHFHSVRGIGYKFTS